MNCIGVLFLVYTLVLPSYGYSKDLQPLHNASQLNVQRRLKNSYDKIDSINSNLLALFYSPKEGKRSSLVIHGLWPHIAKSKNHDAYSCCCDDFITQGTYHEYALSQTANFFCKPTKFDGASKPDKKHEEHRKYTRKCAVPSKDSNTLHEISKILGDTWRDSNNAGKKFWVKEFIKHGTCSGFTFFDYFTKTKKIYDDLIATMGIPLLVNPKVTFSLDKLRNQKTSLTPPGSSQYIAKLKRKPYYRIEVHPDFITKMKNLDLHYVFKCEVEEDDESKRNIVPTKKTEDKKRFLSEVFFCLSKSPSSENDKMSCKSMMKPLDATQDCFAGNGFYI